MTDSLQPPSDPVVFAKPAPAGVKAGFPLLFAALLLCPVLVLTAETWLDGLLAALPSAMSRSTLLLAGLVEALLLATFVFAIVAARRRYGRCELLGDQAAFSVALVAGKKLTRVTVSLSDVQERRETWGGIVLRVRGRGLWSETLFPLLIPTSNEEQHARAVALLDRAELEETLQADPNELTFGRPSPRWLVGALACAVLLPMGFGPLLGFTLSAAPLFTLAFVGGVLFVSSTLATLASGLLTSRYRRVKVGREALLVGNLRIPYAELKHVAQAPPFLVCEGPKATHWVWVGSRLQEARQRLDGCLEAAGLALRVQDTDPEVARRRRQLSIVAIGGLYSALLLGLTAAVVRPPELYASVTAQDRLNNSLRVVYRIGDQQPVFLWVSTHEPAPGSGQLFQSDSVRIRGLFEQTFGAADYLAVDLVEGLGRLPGRSFPIPSGTTCLSVSSQGEVTPSSGALPAALTVTLLEDATLGMVFDCPSLPALLEAIPLDEGNAALAGFVAGKTSARCFEAEDADGWRFVWGIAEGQPVFWTAAPSSQRLEVLLDPIRYLVGTPGGVPIFSAAQRQAVVWPDGGLHALSAQTPLPSPEVLHAVLERIRAGERVVTATRQLGDLWPPGE